MSYSHGKNQEGTGILVIRANRDLMDHYDSRIPGNRPNIQQMLSILRIPNVTTRIANSGDYIRISFYIPT